MTLDLDQLAADLGTAEPLPMTPPPVTSWPAPLAAAAFHGPAGEFVRRLEPHTEADPAAILLQTLVAVGNVFGRTAHFMAEADQHFCNLNCVLVGNTSKGRKGTSWGRTFQLLAKIDPYWPRPVSGLSSGEGLIYHVRAALAVWKCCEASAAYIFGDSLGDPVADEILRALRNLKPEPMTRAEISDLFKRHRTATVIDRALTTLADTGLARRATLPTPGRHTEAWNAL